MPRSTGMFGARRGSMPSADGMDYPRMAWDPRLAWPWCAIRGSMDVFGANRGPRPSADGLVTPTKMKIFWVIKYSNIYSTNK